MNRTPAPARWQQAVVTLVALYPAVLVVDTVLGPHLRSRSPRW